MSEEVRLIEVQDALADLDDSTPSDELAAYEEVLEKLTTFLHEPEQSSYGGA